VFFVFGLLESKEAVLTLSSVTAAGLLLFTRLSLAFNKTLRDDAGACFVNLVAR
jgi:hypothetical protein